MALLPGVLPWWRFLPGTGNSDTLGLPSSLPSVQSSGEGEFINTCKRHLKWKIVPERAVPAVGRSCHSGSELPGAVTSSGD